MTYRLTPLACIAASLVVSTIAGAQTLPRDAELLADDAPPTTAPAATSLDTVAMGPWGFDVAGMDKTVKPGDDFARYAGGAWADKTTIPPDRSRFGAFDALRELSDLRVRRLLEDIGRTAATLPSEASSDAADRAKLAALFASYLNTDEVERRDEEPLNPLLSAVESINTYHDFAVFMGHSHGTLGGGDSLFSAGVGEDAKRPDVNVLYLGQGGLGLPDREYYLNPIYAKQKERYEQYVAHMLGFVSAHEIGETAKKIVAFETRVAECHWTRAESRDRDKTYNPTAIRTLVEQAPGFEWQAFFDAAGVGQAGTVVVEQNTAMPKLAKLLAETPLETLKAWQTFKVIDDAAPLLSSRFADSHFDFHGRFMTGSPQQRDRVKRAASFAQSAMGEAVGREYVAKYFTPDAKAKADQLVQDVRAAMTARIERVDWMSPETKAKALEKMSKFGVKIGYPDKWRDYSMLIVDRNDLFGNAARAARFRYERETAKLGRKVDRAEWGMTPQTVNAYYSPSGNEIVFPAAILQPPFFDANADAAVNYGGIGGVIGHEITHGFDDQGRKSDGRGVLTDWWTKPDAERFDAKAAAFGAQYEAIDFPTVPGSKINAKMTMGENIADLGGVLCALDAYHLHLAGKPAPTLDGFTGDQRVFLGWSQVWRTLSRDAALKQQLATDSHSPGTVRAVAPLRNVDAWYEAFGVKDGDRQYVAPEKRVRIW